MSYFWNYLEPFHFFYFPVLPISVTPFALFSVYFLYFTIFFGKKKRSTFGKCNTLGSCTVLCMSSKDSELQ